MKANVLRATGAALVVLALAGCHKQDVTSIVSKSDADVKLTDVPEHVYWGDTHLHTANSVDAFGFGDRLSPEDSLRFASGEEVTSSTGIKAKLARPLDFLVVTDHSDGLGSTKALYDAPRMMIKDPTLLRWYDMMHAGPRESLKATAEIIHAKTHNTIPAALADPKKNEERTRSVWDDQIRTVERYNNPGKFTAFIGFEWTLMNGGDNLHRNVIFRDGASKAGTVMPLGSLGMLEPDKLWDYMDAYEKSTGGKVLAIPHNSNLSNGLMFMMTEP
ncbi:MAG: DUF3604 domain-containing protein, partial [Sphingomonadales bacterium]|nr:DUF3604 domain-containing protein [Sphingomonadales bacterium]